MTPAASMAALRRVAAAATEHAGEDGLWFAGAVAGYSAGRGATALEEMLGLRPRSGGPSWAVAEDVATRARLILALAVEFYPSGSITARAVALAAALGRYEATAWRTEREWMAPPPDAAGTARALFFAILKAGEHLERGGAPSARTVRRVLQVGHEPPLCFWPTERVIGGVMIKPVRRLRDPHFGPSLTPLADQPAYSALEAELAGLTTRKARTGERRQRARAALKQAQVAPPTGTVVAWAAEMVKGGIVPSADPADELRACASEDRILDVAIDDVTARMSAAHAELSIDACKLFREQHVQAMHALHDGMLQVARAAAALHGIDVQLRLAGYSPHSAVLPAFIPRSVFLVGQPNNFGSEVATFGRWLSKVFGREGL